MRGCCRSRLLRRRRGDGGGAETFNLEFFAPLRHRFSTNTRVQFHINNRVLPAPRPDASLFDCADSLGVRVPTSCHKQGKCKECLVEVTEGIDLLSPRSLEEAHLQENFRLSCRTRIAAQTGVIRCHTLRRGSMRIERHAVRLPASNGCAPLDPAVTRHGEQVLLDGIPIAQTSGPIHGLAIDLGTTTIVVRLLNLETGEIVAA